MFAVYDGVIGLYTRDQATSAIPNGTQVIKIKSTPGDGHAVGSCATVLGSIATERADVSYFYFVEWDNHLGIAVGVISTKILPLKVVLRLFNK